MSLAQVRDGGRGLAWNCAPSQEPGAGFRGEAQLQELCVPSVRRGWGPKCMAPYSRVRKRPLLSDVDQAKEQRTRKHEQGTLLTGKGFLTGNPAESRALGCKQAGHGQQ